MEQQQPGRWQRLEALLAYAFLDEKRLARWERKFSPSSDMNWTKIEALVHGPGASGSTSEGGDSNSAVFACLMAIALSYPEPTIGVYRRRAGREYLIPEHPLSRLLEKPTPNGEFSMEDLWFWKAWVSHIDGNAYWLKVRSGNAETGNVVELWPVSPYLMTPVTEKDNRGKPLDWISYYRMRTGPGPKDFEPVPVNNVIHFRLGVDDRDTRKGLSPLKRLVRQITTDEEADKFTDALLRNMGIPGLVFTPGEGIDIDEDDANRIKAKFREKFGGENRGDVAVLSQDTKVQQFGFSPEQMDMSILHRIPEERISAAIGIPALLAGLGAGLDRATLANARELREFFTENRLVPLWRSDAARLNASLKPDFTSDPNVFIRFDLTNVRALQEDEDKKYTRLNLGVLGKWIKRNEARADVGLEPVEGWDEEDEKPAPLPAPQFDNQNGPQGQPPKMLVDGHLVYNAIETKVSRAQLARIIDEKRRIRASVAGKAETAVDAWFDDLAEAVIGAAAKKDDRVKAHRPNGHNGTALAVKDLTVTDWDRLMAQLFQQQAVGLDNVLNRYTLDVIKLTWPLMNLELQSDAQFAENDPIVQRTLEDAGKNIPDMLETTRQALTDFLKTAYADGQPIEEIADGVRGLIEETYANRGQAIARTEIGRGQNQATGDRFAAAGVKHVLVFDNGFDNSHEFCRRVDGKVVSLEWSRRNSLQHPNCVRAFGAVFNYTGDVFTEEVPWS